MKISILNEFLILKIHFIVIFIKKIEICFINKIQTGKRKNKEFKIRV